MEELDFLIEEALFRIKRDYERSEGQIFLSFSGGKDSTVLAELIKMAQLPTQIPFVFANTRIEFDVTLEFVKNYNYENLIIVMPEKPFGQILKEYGKPALSKNKSEWLNTYQKNIDNPLSTARARQLISGQAEKNGELMGMKTKNALAKKHFNFLHPEQEYKIANKCCTYMKKKPFETFAKENKMNGTFTGVRTAEGGIRALVYKSCVTVKQKRGKDYYMSMPIIDWEDHHVDEFVKRYNVQLSKAYTVYGCERTGCVGCPLAKTENIQKELEMVYEYEPNRYKAAISWLKDVYADQGIELPFDPKYMEYYEERKEVVKKRRKEMQEKYKDLRG